MRRIITRYWAEELRECVEEIEELVEYAEERGWEETWDVHREAVEELMVEIARVANGRPREKKVGPLGELRRRRREEVEAAGMVQVEEEERVMGEVARRTGFAGLEGIRQSVRRIKRRRGEAAWEERAKVGRAVWAAWQEGLCEEAVESLLGVRRATLKEWAGYGIRGVRQAG